MNENKATATGKEAVALFVFRWPPERRQVSARRKLRVS